MICKVHKKYKGLMKPRVTKHLEGCTCKIYWDFFTTFDLQAIEQEDEGFYLAAVVKEYLSDE
jgi:hypothetical protein